MLDVHRPCTETPADPPISPPLRSKCGQRVLDAQSILVQKHPLAGPLITAQFSDEARIISWLTGLLTEVYLFLTSGPKAVRLYGSAWLQSDSMMLQIQPGLIVLMLI